MKGEPIVRLKGTEFGPSEGETLKQQVLRFFISQGGSAESPFGKILLDDKGVKNDLAHANYLNKTHAFAAIKDVLERGHVTTPFNYHNIHGKNQPTGIISGYIMIAEQPFRMDITVIGNEKGERRLYCHDVYQIPITENHQKGVITKHVLEESNRCPSRNPFGDFANVNDKSDISNNMSHNPVFCVTESELCRIVESVLREINGGRTLNEIYLRKPGEPLVAKRIGEYEVVNGCMWGGILDDLKKMGEVEDVRLYSSTKKNGKTYALYKRLYNGKFFFVEVVDDENNPKKSKAVGINSKDVPEPIVSDALSLIRRDRRGLNLFS